ncbi:MAG: succinate dehydrogenase cytochrome b subunit [Bacteroidetes bacterium]|nr:succinate dehydrogenase cytochrome b subunit [Bacteroidota bacterium]
MNWFKRTFSYSIGKKLIMSLTGLFLVIYLIEHAIGNSLLFLGDGGETFNEFSHYMAGNPIIRVIEIILFAGILFHVFDGFYLWFQNRGARPIKYDAHKHHDKVAWSSRNMIVSGSIVLIFLIVHLKTFFYPYRIVHSVPDLYQATVDAFSSTTYSAFYVFAMVLLGLHLHHGFASAFQTLGMRHPNYYGMIKMLGMILAVGLSGIFAAMPIYFQLAKYLG